jgi:hypothetical protein
LLAHGDVALTNDMLKDYKVGKAYEYFSSGWLQEGYFLKAKCHEWHDHVHQANQNKSEGGL